MNVFEKSGNVVRSEKEAVPLAEKEIVIQLLTEIKLPNRSYEFSPKKFFQEGENGIVFISCADVEDPRWSELFEDYKNSSGTPARSYGVYGDFPDLYSVDQAIKSLNPSQPVSHLEDIAFFIENQSQGQEGHLSIEHDNYFLIEHPNGGRTLDFEISWSDEYSDHKNPRAVGWWISVCESGGMRLSDKSILFLPISK